MATDVTLTSEADRSDKTMILFGSRSVSADGMRPNFQDLLIIYAVLSPTAVLYWHATALLLDEWLGSNVVKLVVGFVSTAAVYYLHDTFRNSAPTSSQYLRAAYEVVYDYMVHFVCLCYHLGCRSIYDFLIDYGVLRPMHVAIVAAHVLIRFSGFRKVMWFPMVVSNDNAVERYRPLSSLSFHSGTQLMVWSVP